MNYYEELKIKQSEEYKEYLKALCRWSSQFVTRIRAQYARKAFQMYQNETVRRIVLAYGEEAEDLDKHRLQDFDFIADHPEHETAEVALEDWCLNKANSYGETIALLFEIV